MGVQIKVKHSFYSPGCHKPHRRVAAASGYAFGCTAALLRYFTSFRNHLARDQMITITELRQTSFAYDLALKLDEFSNTKIEVYESPDPCLIISNYAGTSVVATQQAEVE